MRGVVLDRKGFTLAETLVAAVLIGILAIVLIPILNKSSPDKDRVVLRKTYTTLAQAVTTMINDDTNYLDPVKGFNNTTPTSNIISGTTYYNKFCYFLADLLNTVGSTSCPTDSQSGMRPDSVFHTTDGVYWYMYLGGNDSAPNTQFPISFSSYGTYIIVDVNGPQKGSNCIADSSGSTYLPTGGSPTPAYSTCVSSTPSTTPCEHNPDTFAIGVRYDGMMHAGSIAGRDYCAEFILKNPTENRKQID